MENLILKITKTIMIAVLCGFSLQLFSQGNKTKQEAYKNSYSMESVYLYSQAINEISKLNDTNSYYYNVRLGWLTYLNKQYNQSMNYYQTAIKLMPNSIEAKLGFVNPAAAMGNWDIVIKKYIEILKIDPQNFTVNYRMGLYYYNKEDYTSAISYFEKIAKLYPYDYDTQLMYAWTTLKLGKLNEAKYLFNLVLLIRPNDKSALEGLSLIK